MCSKGLYTFRALRVSGDGLSPFSGVSGWACADRPRDGSLALRAAIFHGSRPAVGVTAGLTCVTATAPVSGAVLFLSAIRSIADTSQESPAKMSPPRKPPVRWLIAPIA